MGQGWNTELTDTAGTTDLDLLRKSVVPAVSVNSVFHPCPIPVSVCIYPNSHSCIGLNSRPQNTSLCRPRSRATTRIWPSWKPPLRSDQ
jgi:hypothetical protein